MWKQKIIETSRGAFEYFVKGKGEPLAITHFYMAFNENGNWFANPFTEHYQVFLINVRGAGNSPTIEVDDQMKLEEIILDLEAIREALHIPKWAGFCWTFNRWHACITIRCFKKTVFNKIDMWL